jgi:hypothetical protein
VTAPDLIDDLKSGGLILSANGDRLKVDAPAGTVTPALRATLAARKPELLAVLTGKPVASDTPGIAWDPRGGCRVATPPDLRALCSAAGWRLGFPAVSPDDCPGVEAGHAAWSDFTENGAFEDVVAVLLELNGKDERRERQREAEEAAGVADRELLAEEAKARAGRQGVH